MKGFEFLVDKNGDVFVRVDEPFKRPWASIAFKTEQERDHFAAKLKPSRAEGWRRRSDVVDGKAIIEDY